MRFGLKITRIRGDLLILTNMARSAKAASLSRVCLIQSEPLPKSKCLRGWRRSRSPRCGPIADKSCSWRRALAHQWTAPFVRRPIPRFGSRGGSDAKIHDIDGCGACACSVSRCRYGTDSVPRRGASARANSKCHADRQRRRLPRLWAILPAGHDPALRTLPLLVRPLLIAPGAAPEQKARPDVLFSTARREE
jgi:hypothetical protein